MSYKVHLSPDGIWRRCSAKPGNCKFGGEEGHKSFANEQEFKDWEGAENRKEFGIAGKIKNLADDTKKDKEPKTREQKHHDAVEKERNKMKTNDYDFLWAQLDFGMGKLDEAISSRDTLAIKKATRYIDIVADKMNENT